MDTNEREARNEIARLIRAGMSLIVETRWHWYTHVEETPCGCALATAWVGKRGRAPALDLARADGWEGRGGHIAYYACEVPETGIIYASASRTFPSINLFTGHAGPPTLGEVINALHAWEGWTRDAIVMWLETDKIPEDPEAFRFTEAI